VVNKALENLYGTDAITPPKEVNPSWKRPGVGCP